MSGGDRSVAVVIRQIQSVVACTAGDWLHLRLIQLAFIDMGLMTACNAIQDAPRIWKSNKVHESSFFMVKVIGRYADSPCDVVDDCSCGYLRREV
ncbi:hypothetical protein D3C71_1702080 [compost metagenome]